MKVELDYATKADLKPSTKFAKNVDLSSLKSSGDKLDIDQSKKEKKKSN